MLSLSNDYKNPNFRLDRLDEDYQEYAREKLITDDHKLIYAFDEYDGGTAIVVLLNEKYHKVVVHRMFRMPKDEVVHSTDIDAGIAETNGRGENP